MFHSPCRLLAVLVLSGLASACAGDPWVDSRREGGQIKPVGLSTPDQPAICFASGDAAAEDVAALAQQVCAQTGRTAVHVRTSRWQCTLMTPHRAVFSCR